MISQKFGGSFVAVILSLALISVVSAQQVSYFVDDGSAEASLAISGAQNLWLNVFQTSETISLSTVSVAFGSNSNADPPTNGTAFTGYIWSDPTNDGNPSDATVIRSFTDVIQGIHTDTFFDFGVSEVGFNSGDFFFVGFQAPDFAVGRDTGSNSGQSYVFSNGNSALLDPNALGAISTQGEFGSLGFRGNAMIRASGVTVSPIETPDPDLTYLVTDVGAINSLQTTGLLMPSVQEQAVINASQTALHDLNDRLFRARAYGNKFGNGSSVSSLDAPISRYLHFAARNKIDYRVAIGLREAAPPAQDTIAKAETLWLSAPFAMLGGPIALSKTTYASKAVLAAPAGVVAKNPVDDKVIIGDQSFSRWEVFSTADYGYYDQDNLNALARGFRSDSYSATVGVEHRLLSWLHVGGAVTRLSSDTKVAGDLGSVDLDGTLLSTYFTAFYKEFYFDFLYSYGNYENEVRRNTLFGRNALGDTDSYSENIDINIGYTHQLTDQIRTGPYAGLNYTLGRVDGYTERGGGTANLIYNEDDFESMIGRLGWQLSVVERIPAGRLTVQGRAAFAHDFRPESSGTQVNLLNSPFTLVNAGGAQSIGGLGAISNTAHAGADWLELGTGVRLDLENQWNASIDYSGQFGRNNASAHFVGARVGYVW